MMFRVVVDRDGFVARRSAESGQALAEVAIISLVLLSLLLGCIDFGRYTYDGILIANAANAGVEYGAQNLTTAANTAGMVSAAQTDEQSLAGSITPVASSYCACSDGSASTCLPTDCAASHRLTYVKVTTSGTFGPFVNFPGIPTSIVISRTAYRQVSP